MNREEIMKDLFIRHPDDKINPFIFQDPQVYTFLNIHNFDNTWAEFTQDLTEQERVAQWKTWNYRFEDNKHVLDGIPPEHILKGREDWPVTYRYNSDWFRCDEFTSKHDGRHIVFSGCSNTEGVGTDIEKTWSHIVYTELSKTNKLSGYFNLAKGGNGWQQTVRNFMVYVKKYGAPEFLLINMPNILRNYEWHDDLNRWIFMQKNPYDGVGSDMSDPNAPKVEDHKIFFPIWVNVWNLFLNYCEAIGTKVIWSTWDMTEATNIEASNFFHDSFFRLGTVDQDYIQKRRPNLNLYEDDLRARDGHPGLLPQTYWAENYLFQLKEIGWNIDETVIVS